MVKMSLLNAVSHTGNTIIIVVSYLGRCWTGVMYCSIQSAWIESPCFVFVLHRQDCVCN